MGTDLISSLCFSKYNKFNYIMAPATYDTINNFCVNSSPNSGLVDQVFIKSGDKVAKGQDLCVMIWNGERHLMQVPFDGIIEKVFYDSGNSVVQGSVLLKYEELF